MAATQAQVDAVLQRMRQMSAADLAVLAASTQTSGSSMTTAPGSANQVAITSSAAPTLAEFLRDYRTAASQIRPLNA